MSVSLELLSRPAPRPDLFDDLVLAVREPLPMAAAAELTDAAVRRQWRIPEAQWLGQPTPDAVAGVITAGGGAEVELWALGAHDAADVVIAATHAGVGFGPGLQPRAMTAAQVWTLIAAAIAALTGEDVRRTWLDCGAGDGREPHGPAAAQRQRISALPRGAREAVRDVLTCVLVPQSRHSEVMAALAADIGVA